MGGFTRSLMKDALQMKTDSAILRLVCGTVDEHDELQDESSAVLSGLARLLSDYYAFTIEFKKNLDAPQSSYFLPVALRSLMESAAIALLLRIDPLRVILSSKSQSSVNYNKASPQPAALKWKDDIVGDASKRNNDPNAPPKGLWDSSIAANKLQRHLLSDQMCEAFWIPATTNLFNCKQLPDSNWMTMLQGHTAVDLPRKLIGDGNQIYSELSKGIHPEFAVKREAEYDKATLQTYIERTLQWVASLGLLSHCTPTFSARIEMSEALQHLRTIEEVTT